MQCNKNIINIQTIDKKTDTPFGYAGFCCIIKYLFPDNYYLSLS